MARVAYIEKKFRASSLEIIAAADSIASDYAARGYDLTLRQLYYQFVSRDLLANSQKNYDRLGAIVSDARLAGLLDWDHLEDRTRNVYGLPTWGEPGDLLRQNVYRFRTDLWRNQAYHLEVWVEKQALESVVAGAANQRQVDYFSCRGYVSQSEMRAAAQRFKGHSVRGKRNVIIHLGDHDPSGIDMTRDIVDRMDMFGAHVEVSRIALNMDQIEQYDPPPNPAKLTDSRVDGYMERFGSSSWELDALDPEVLNDLIIDKIDTFRDESIWDEDEAKQDRMRDELQATSEAWDEVAEFLRSNGYL